MIDVDIKCEKCAHSQVCSCKKEYESAVAAIRSAQYSYEDTAYSYAHSPIAVVSMTCAFFCQVYATR